MKPDADYMEPRHGEPLYVVTMRLRLRKVEAQLRRLRARDRRWQRTAGPR